MLACHDVSIAYDGRKVLDAFSLFFDQSESSSCLLFQRKFERCSTNVWRHAHEVLI